MYVGQPPPPEEVFDRDDIVGDIAAGIQKPRVRPLYALLGFRRIGKTSILSKLKRETEKRGMVVVYYDVKEHASDPEAFLSDLERAILDEYGKRLGVWRKLKSRATATGGAAVQKITNAISGIDEIGVEVSADGAIAPKVHFGERREEDYSRAFKAVFRTADRVAETAGTRVILMLDEFQDILKLSRYKGLKNVLELYRAALQQRGNVVHIISGSKIHMIQKMLEDADYPIFQHFIMKYVGPFDAKDAKDFFSLMTRANETEADGEGILRAGSEAIALVGGHPYYLMFLAEAWDGKETIRETFNRLISAPTGPMYIYANYILSEDIGQAEGGPLLVKIVKTMAKHGGPMRASALARSVGKGQNYLRFYIDQLVKFDVIQKTERGTYEIVDRVVGETIRHNA